MRFLLTYQISIVGISAPWFSWFAALILIIWPAWEIFSFLRLQKRQNKSGLKFINNVKDLQNQYGRRGNEGVNAEVIDILDQLFTAAFFLTEQWNNFRSKLIYRTISNGDSAAQVWATESSAKVFAEDLFLGQGFNKKRFLAIPGIVTGTGLLMTFVAILVGLLGVSIDNSSNKVLGLENLIGGLSGKFISSVAALFSATVFIYIEKGIFHKLNGLRFSLINTIDSLIPLRSDTHILEDIYQNIAEQTEAFRLFNSDLSIKLSNSFSQSMGPTLERMVESIDNLNKLTDSSKAELLESIKEMNQLLKRSEQTRVDSVSGRLEELLQSLQKSLSESIDRMSREFTKSLTGSTQDQFDRVAKSIGDTAEVLTKTQKGLQILIETSETTTRDQFANSSELINLMVKTLGGTVDELLRKVDELSVKMTDTIEDTAKKSSESSGEVISAVKDLNEQSVEKFIKVLEKHEQQMDKAEDFKKTLHEAIGEFGKHVNGYNKMNSNLQNIFSSASTTMEQLSQASKQAKDIQESFRKIADLTGNNIRELVKSNEEQTEIWEEIGDSMDQYKQVFGEVESSAVKILTDISEHLHNFTDATKSHFERTVTVANDHVNKAVGQLQSSIEELSEKLDDLSETVEKIDDIYKRAKRL